MELQDFKTPGLSRLSNPRMRLDLFLKASRLCPRRSVAQKLCEAGLVTVGARTAKSAQTINPGDEITISRRDRITTVRVKAVPEGRHAPREEAGSLFEIIRDEVVKYNPGKSDANL